MCITHGVSQPIGEIEEESALRKKGVVEKDEISPIAKKTNYVHEAQRKGGKSQPKTMVGITTRGLMMGGLALESGNNFFNKPKGPPRGECQGIPPGLAFIPAPGGNRIVDAGEKVARNTLGVLRMPGETSFK